MKFFKKLNNQADDQSDQGDDFVLVDDDETPDSETCTWEECIACIKVSFFVYKIGLIVHTGTARYKTANTGARRAGHSNVAEVDAGPN